MGSRTGGTRSLADVVTPINSVTLQELIILLAKMEYPGAVTVRDINAAKKMKERLIKVFATMS